MLLNDLTRKMTILPFMLMFAVAVMTVGATPIKCKVHLFPRVEKAVLTALQHVSSTRRRAPTTPLEVFPSCRPSKKWMC
jgi:hypothetical protein